MLLLAVAVYFFVGAAFGSMCRTFLAATVALLFWPIFLTVILIHNLRNG